MRSSNGSLLSFNTTTQSSVVGEEGKGNKQQQQLAASTSTNSSNRRVAETKVVVQLKIVLLCILIASTVGVALLVFFYTNDAEWYQFEQHFIDEASTLLNAVQGTFFLSMAALDSYVVDLVSYAEYSDSNWPFVTVPNHAVRAAKIRTITKAFHLAQHLLVAPEQREAWEAFSVHNDTWVDEAMNVQLGDANYHGLFTSPESFQPYGTIFDMKGHPSPQEAQHYLPTWSAYPVVPFYPPYNWDAYQFGPIASSYKELFEERRVVVKISNLPDHENEESMSEASLMNDWAKSFIKDSEDETEPIINVYYPISTDCLHSVTQPTLVTGDHKQQQQSSSSSSSNVVGIADASIYWRELLQNILPEGTGGIVAVFEIADKTFTYAVDGSKTTYLGRGDLHDPAYDHLEESSHFLDVNQYADSYYSTYTGLPLNKDAQNYRIRVYPTKAMEKTFISHDAMIYTIFAVLSFAFTSFLFILYDHLRSNALERMTHTAQTSTANVALLEEMVLERTRELETTNRKLEEANRRVVRASEAQLQHFASMSHEIRTPLNCVIGISSLLQESGDLNPMQSESMQMIMSSGELLLTIINDVLDYSKLESGNVEIDVKPSNLQDALSSTIHSMNLRGAAQNVKVNALYDPLVPQFIHTDVRRLSQVLYNLIGNAVKFSNKGGTVEFHVSVRTQQDEAEDATTTTTTITTESDDTTIKTRTDCCESSSSSSSSNHNYSPPRIYKGQYLPPLKGNVIRFVVKDYGRGINQQDFPKIFHPFSQADHVTESIYGGTGLGLSITSKLVHGLGGSISVESVEGEWSKFTVDLPFNEPPVDTSAITLGLKDTTILLIGCDQKVEHDRMMEIFKCLKVDCASYNTFQELVSENNTILSSSSSERTPLFIANEAMFDPEIYENLVQSSRKKPVLLTFGPAFKVKDARAHYRSLTQILPSILLNKIIQYTKEDSGREHSRKSRVVRSMSVGEHDIAERLKTMRFLIAEDNLVNQKVLSRILTRLGIENIVIVDNGAKAVEREKSEPFDFVFMDMQMPIMCGTEATKIINARVGDHRPAKVIFCTAHALDQCEKECYDSGAAGFLAKPCTIQGVEECLRKVVMENR